MFRPPPILALVAAVTALTTVTACDDDADDQIDEQVDEQVELTFAFQPQENPEGLQLDADRFAEFIGEQTGYEAEVFMPTNYSAVVEALRGDNADVAYFSGLPYMMAHDMADAQLLVVEERDGQPYYYSQWYTRAELDVESLADLEDRSIAFTSPTSTSGYLFPMAEVIQQDLTDADDPEAFFGEVVFAGGYEQALRALLNGQVDAAAASDYALRQYLTEDERDDIRVVTDQGPVPTHGLAVRGNLDDEIKEAVRQALLTLNDDEHRQLLESVYGAERLVERDHADHVRALKTAYELVEIDQDI